MPVDNSRKAMLMTLAISSDRTVDDVVSRQWWCSHDDDLAEDSGTATRS